MKPARMKSAILCLVFVLVALASGLSHAYVPVRISIKFIVDANNNRPATGNLNTDAEINAEVSVGYEILSDVLSELRLQSIELVDVTGVQQWYTADATEANRDNLRTAAQANQPLYLWRTNAINIYINAGTGSAISDFPPNNNIILMNQWCANAPSCILHEIGHSINLLHTHEGGGNDGCADTVSDNQYWTRDQIALNNFGCTYANCTAFQQDQVDLVFNNVMSYHTSEPQLRLSACQMDRMSTQADSDRNWLLARIPIYVNSGYSGSSNGRFSTPYSTLQGAVNAGGLSGKAFVLQQGSYTLSSPINDNVQLVTRFGQSTVDKGALLYQLPVDLEKSKTPEIRGAIESVQEEDKHIRHLGKIAREARDKATSKGEKDEIIRAHARETEQAFDRTMTYLKEAEGFAEGKEKIAIQLELAQRYRDNGRCADAIDYFREVVESTVQEHLRTRALFELNRCQERLRSGAQGNGILGKDD